MGKGENRSRGEIERSREGKEPKKKKKKGEEKRGGRERKTETEGWFDGSRVESSGIRSRKRITCYPTYPTGIRPPWPSLSVLPPITSDPSSNVFSPHPFLHVHFSPASATIPDVVETNSSFPQLRKGMADRRKGGGSCYFSNVCVLNACRNFEKGGIPFPSIVISDFFLWVYDQ